MQGLAVPAAADRSTAAKRQKTAEGGTLWISSNLDGRKCRANPPRLATAKAGMDGSPATSSVDGSPGCGMLVTTILSDDNNDNKPIAVAASTAPQKPRKCGRAMTDNQPATNRKMASGTALAGRRRVAPEEGAVVRASLPTGTPLTMDDDNVDIDDSPGTTSTMTLMTSSTTTKTSTTTTPSMAMDLVDRPFGGLATTGGTRPTRVCLTARVTERKRPFEEEACSAQGVRDTDAQARNRSVSGGGGADIKPQGKTGQGVSSADFFVADKR